MLRPTILVGLAPVLAVVACLRTDGGALAGGGPARGTAGGEKREAEKPVVEEPRPAAEGAKPAVEAKPAGTPLERKLEAIRKINEYAGVLMQIGRGPGLDFHYAWSKRQMETEREAAKNAKERTAAADGHLKRMRVLEKHHAAKKIAPPVAVEARLNALDHLSTEFYVAEAEQWLADAQAAEKQAH